MNNLIKSTMKRVLCFVMALTLFCAIPVSKTEAAGAPIAVGIDVSRWQGPINWSAVAASGVTFAFIKVGSMNSGLDPYFVQNMWGAQAAGIKTGVYIYSYAKNVEQAAAEAQFVLSAISNFRIMMPVVFDIEDKTQKSLPAAELSMMANTFCAMVEAEGYYPMVYANKYWFTTKLPGVMYDKWIAQWAGQCDIPDAAFWQFTEKGSVPGVGGSVDMNYQFKDLSASIVDTGWVARRGAMYYYKDYKMQRGWTDVAGARYFLGADGRMYVGWLPLEDHMYFLQANGVMAVGFTPIGTAMYCFDSEGRMLTGMQTIDGLQYLFTPEGMMYVGMYYDGSHYMYFDIDGHMLKGLSVISGQNYYFDENGYMHTGWVPMNGQMYLFAESGPMCYGWFDDGVYRYYLSPEDGHRVSGWMDIEGARYFFDENGHMQTGYLEQNGITYLFGANGAMYTGWYQNGAARQYFAADGTMVKGIASIDGATYYFDEQGNMQTGWVTIGASTYLFNVDGTMVTDGWYNDGVNTYYLSADGSRLENVSIMLDGAIYLFDQNGVALLIG